MNKKITILLGLFIIQLGYAQSLDSTHSYCANKGNSYSIEFVSGLSSPQGDLKKFVLDGFNSGIKLNRDFCKNISVGLSLNHQRFNHRQDLGLVKDSTRQRISATSFDMGPKYSFSFWKLALETYGRTGLSFVNSPEILIFAPRSNLELTRLKEYTNSALTIRAGANLTASVCKGLNLYLGYEYATNLNSDLNYQNRDLSKAMLPDGSLDPDIASEIPFVNKTISLSMTNVNFGVTMTLGKINQPSAGSTCRGKAQDHNSVRSNKSSVAAPDPIDLKGDSTGSSSGTRAQDHNSVRSNKSSVAAPNPIDLDGDSSGSSSETRAQDHNSVRSNKSSVVQKPDVGSDSTATKGGSKAQDHNSTRSNKTGN